MFRGEHNSLNAIADAVPEISLCPKSYGYGTLIETKKGIEEIAFLVTEFLDMQPGSSSHTAAVAARNTDSTAGKGGGGAKKSLSLAAKLAKLHSTPAPIPPGKEGQKFGFPVTTCCGDTPQDNSYMDTWAEFFAEKRLLSVMKRCEKRNGRDEEVGELVDVVVKHVVPRLLGDEYDEHDNDGDGSRGKGAEEKKKKGKREITPVVVHGDLWAGNKCYATMIEGGFLLEEVIFDPSASYAHSEYEFGIMRLFGGFDFDDHNGGGEFERDYWGAGKIKKLEPVEEFDDRVELYGLYHQLNHYAIFGRGYRAGAVRVMERLVGKYGKG